MALHGKFFGLCSADWLDAKRTVAKLMQNILNKYHSLYYLLALDLLNSTLRCFPFLSKLLEQLHNFPGQLICTKHLPRQGESLRRRVSNCILHYYGLCIAVVVIVPGVMFFRFSHSTRGVGLPNETLGQNSEEHVYSLLSQKYQYKLHTVHTLFGKVREVAHKRQEKCSLSICYNPKFVK